jgi:putative ABC transport system substrate-binding protein
MQFDQLGRRAFITLLGGAAAWPLVVRAQQPALPVIGFLHSGSPEAYVNFVAAFRKGLSETGYVEGQNVAFEFRWAAGQDSGLPELAADLTRRRVAVIAAPSTPAAIAAKAATTTIPIVFAIGYDPVALGLVASLARPGGNLTGISFLSGELAAKRLELVRELKVGATRVAVLVNPALASAETNLKDVEAAARAIGLQIQGLRASSSRELDAAFATFLRERPDALFVSGDPLFMSRRVQIVQLTTLHKLAATFAQREFVEVGGLMSYGANVADAWRQAGVYTGRILKGAKPADLPVVQSSKFELVINAQTARMLGITVPDKLLVAADEVIE